MASLAQQKQLTRQLRALQKWQDDNTAMIGENIQNYMQENRSDINAIVHEVAGSAVEDISNSLTRIDGHDTDISNLSTNLNNEVTRATAAETANAAAITALEEGDVSNNKSDIADVSGIAHDLSTNFVTHVNNAFDTLDLSDVDLQLNTLTMTTSVTAPTFVGDLSGNALSATKATSDASDNNIALKFAAIDLSLNSISGQVNSASTAEVANIALDASGELLEQNNRVDYVLGQLLTFVNKITDDPSLNSFVYGAGSDQYDISFIPQLTNVLQHGKFLDDTYPVYI